MGLVQSQAAAMQNNSIKEHRDVLSQDDSNYDAISMKFCQAKLREKKINGGITKK